jgi:hypothetical protein
MLGAASGGDRGAAGVRVRQPTIGGARRFSRLVGTVSRESSDALSRVRPIGRESFYGQGVSILYRESWQSMEGGLALLEHTVKFPSYVTAPLRVQAPFAITGSGGLAFQGS